MLPTPLRHGWMTHDIEMLRDQARRFVAAELVPELPHWRAEGFADRGTWQKVGSVGMLLPELPEAFGAADATLKPAESVEAGDDFKPVGVVKAEEAWISRAESKYELWK